MAAADKPLQNFEISLANYVALDMTKGIDVTGQEDPQLFRVRPRPISILKHALTYLDALD